MMDELKQVKKAVNPTEILLVVDAMTGQEAAGIISQPKISAASLSEVERVLRNVFWFIMNSLISF